MRAVKAGFTHVMIDYADQPLEKNVRGTQEIINLVRPLGISVEAEIGHIIKSSDASSQRAPTVSVEEAKGVHLQGGRGFAGGGGRHHARHFQGAARD